MPDSLSIQLLQMNCVGPMPYAVGRRGWIPPWEGQHQLWRYPTLEAAKASFTKQFRRWTGNAWEDRDQGDKLGKGTVGHTAHERERLASQLSFLSSHPRALLLLPMCLRMATVYAG